MPSNNRNKKQTNQDKTKPYRVPRKAQANLKERGFSNITKMVFAFKGKEVKMCQW